ncbi:DHA2 family efflux MFS transporter permease subunit [Actinomycetospora endophytica]|uniref:DHA2 family efflux MFS transporter permease subunit n=1 Tax=Actinomycetospora endophytica TaxID=2291215 RepID=A0ABS8P495_9PSEU|nr:DHA2 family efflux MFS transporter permease subunit [Actinomycetospora endophytica]MCD2192853.1 DHA2 family efflux MFS transporter permease subunit [Actinomycetospora endophytica]
MRTAVGGRAGAAQLTLGLGCLTVFMANLDTTILNVALPTMGHELGAATSGLQWTVNAYVLARAGSLFVCASLGDRFGHRRIWVLGLILFGAGSLACGLAPNLGAMIGFRVVQSLGGALMTPATLAMLAHAYPSGPARAQALGIWSASTGIAMGLGPVVGGLLVDSVGWRSVFMVNVPIVVVALASWRLVTDGARPATPPRLDLLGQTAIIAALFPLTYALITAPERGWTSPLTLSLIGVSVLAGASFVAIERRSSHPLLDLDDFRRPALLGAIALAIAAFVTLGGFLFFNTLWLQEVRGLSALQAGLLTAPATLSSFLLSPTAGRIVGRIGPRVPATAGATCLAAATAWMALTVSTAGPVWDVIPGYVLLGIGLGLTNTPVNTIAVSSMPADRSGVAGAIATTSRQVGSNLGVALLGTIVFSGTFVPGLNHAYGLAAVVSVLAAGFAWWALRTGQRAGSTP